MSRLARRGASTAHHPLLSGRGQAAPLILPAPAGPPAGRLQPPPTTVITGRYWSQHCTPSAPDSGQQPVCPLSRYSTQSAPDSGLQTACPPTQGSNPPVPRPRAATRLPPESVQHTVCSRLRAATRLPPESVQHTVCPRLRAATRLPPESVQHTVFPRLRAADCLPPDSGEHPDFPLSPDSSQSLPDQRGTRPRGTRCSPSSPPARCQRLDIDGGRMTEDMTQPEVTDSGAARICSSARRNTSDASLHALTHSSSSRIFCAPGRR